MEYIRKWVTKMVILKFLFKPNDDLADVNAFVTAVGPRQQTQGRRRVDTRNGTVWLFQFCEYGNCSLKTWSYSSVFSWDPCLTILRPEKLLILLSCLEYYLHKCWRQTIQNICAETVTAANIRQTLTALYTWNIRRRATRLVGYM